MRDEGTDVLTPSCVCFHVSVYSIFLQALVHRRSRALQQVPTRNALVALHNHVPLAACFQI
jgi:hypothetical protein